MFGWDLVEEKIILDAAVSISQLTVDSATGPNWTTGGCGSAQGFKATSSLPICKFTFRMKYVIAQMSGTFTGYIYSDGGSGPDTLLATFSNFDASTVTSSDADYDFTGYFVPTVGTQYYIVMMWTGGSANTGYRHADTANAPYTDGLQYEKEGGAWSNYGSGSYDSYFKIYQGGPQTSHTFSNLDGDTDEEYRLIIRHVSANSGICRIRPNNDTGQNYGWQRLTGTNTTLAAATSVEFGINLCEGTSGINFGECVIHAKSGYVRSAIAKSINTISTTTVTDLKLYGWNWDNVSDNITSLVINSDVDCGLGVGTHIFLMKKRTTAGGCWKLLYNTTLTGAVSSLTISSIDGDTDVLYELRARVIGGANGAECWLRINNDATANIYGIQYLDGIGTGVASSRATYNRMFPEVSAGRDIGDITLFSLLLYAKSGYVRTAIHEAAANIASTTVGSMEIGGHSYNNTSDNITSIVFGDDAASGLGTGTVIELWKYSLTESYTKSFTDDAFTITDSRSRSMTRPILDTATLTGTINKAAARTVSDIMTITDAINKGFSRTMAEIMAISDTIVRRITQVWAETITITEVGVRAISLFIDDTITVTDTFIRAAVRIFTDSIDLSDVLIAAKKWLRITHVASTWTKTTNAVSTWTKAVKGASIWQILKR